MKRTGKISLFSLFFRLHRGGRLCYNANRMGMRYGTHISHTRVDRRIVPLTWVGRMG